MKDTRVRQPYGQKSGTCAGCGKAMWRGSTSRPPGEAMCRPCRAGRRRSEAVCRACGETFEAEHSGGRIQRVCSDACRVAVMRAARVGAPKRRPCPDCATLVLGCGSGKRCEPCKAVRTQHHNRVKNMRRRGAQVVGGTLTLPELGVRDGWLCHLCRKPVDPTRRGNDPLAPTFDHLIPIVDGGTDAPENLRLAHRTCNVKRGTGGVVQLLLVG